MGDTYYGDENEAATENSDQYLRGRKRNSEEPEITPLDNSELSHLHLKPQDEETPESIPYGYPCTFTFINPESGLLSFENGFERAKRILYTGLIIFVVVNLYSSDNVLFTRISKALMKVSLIISEIFYPILFTSIALSFGLMKDIFSGIISGKCKKPCSCKNFWSSGCKMLFSWVYIKRFLVMAICDTLGSVLTMFPIIKLDPLLVMLLKQFSFPFTMLMAKWYLNKIYKKNHFIGSFVIFMAIIFYLVSSHSNAGKNLDFHTDILWCLLYLIALLPITFGVVYKEKYIKDMDVLWTTIGVALIQTILSIPLAASILIPTPEESTLVNEFSGFNITSDIQIINTTLIIPDVISYVTFGYRCITYDFRKTLFFEIHNKTSFFQYGLNTGGSLSVWDEIDTLIIDPVNITGISSTINVMCNSTGFYYAIFMFINVYYNIAITQLLKLTTSNITAIVHIFVLAFANFLYTFKALAGPAVRSISILDVICLICISGGAATFWLKAEEIPLKEVKKKPLINNRMLKNRICKNFFTRIPHLFGNCFLRCCKRKKAKEDYELQPIDT